METRIKLKPHEILIVEYTPSAALGEFVSYAEKRFEYTRHSAAHWSEFVKSYLRKSSISVDPFARNKRWATYTNDLNPDTAAEYHMDSVDFLKMLFSKGIKPDLFIFDPPYSPRQIKECYDGIGMRMKSEDAWRTSGWKPERDIIAEMQSVGGVVLNFGWNSNGMGNGRFYEIDEILLIAHGSAHNDTICMAERKTASQSNMFKVTTNDNPLAVSII